MKKTEIIKIGRGVLEIESRAISALVSRLDENFSKAVDLLAENKSRIVVTGMGKSGLIGRKIAATRAQGREGSRSQGHGPDRQLHRRPGSGRCAGHRLDEKERVQRGGFRPL